MQDELFEDIQNEDLERIEAYGDSISEAITKLDMKLKKRGLPKITKRHDGRYVCGTIRYTLIDDFSSKKIERQNLVWHTKQNKKHKVVVFTTRRTLYPLCEDGIR